MGSKTLECGWRAGKQTAVGAALLFILLALVPGMSAAAPGDLDPSFGSGGKVVTDFGGDYGGASAIAVQPDGKIVVAGNTGHAYETRSFAIARYNSDGSLDNSFAGDGMQTTDIGGGFGSGGHGLALQPDGKIVVVGLGGGVGSEHALVARYTTDGSLDSTFSTDGKVTLDFYSASAVVIQPDGKILIGGSAPFSFGGSYGIARLTSSGDLDPTFSEDGIQTVSITGLFEGVAGLDLDSAGRIVAGGRTETDWGLLRLSPDGELDPTFSGDGKQRTDFGGTYDEGSDNLTDLVVQADDRIIGVGWKSGTSLLARYDADGTLDSAFTQTITGSEHPSNAVALQANGKIVTAGGSLAGFAVARRHANGPLDGGFLGDGLGTIPFAGYRAHDLAVQADGKIVVVGGDKDDGIGSDAEFGLVRLQGGDDTTPPETTITSGPFGSISIPNPTFGFVSSETNSSFQCRVDGAGVAPCLSPRTIAAVSTGAHAFQVRAIDASGNVDPTPAARSFSVLIPTTTPKPPTAACLTAKRKRTRLVRSVRVLTRKAKQAKTQRSRKRYRRKLRRAKRELVTTGRVVQTRCGS
jgi:uncharacterized delta-60 repeat protein